MCDKFGPRYGKACLDNPACFDDARSGTSNHQIWVHANSMKCAVHHIALYLAVLCVNSVLCVRAAYAFLLMFTAPFIFGIAAVHTAPGYIISRFLIGWALAAFVTCQFWTSIMFSPNVVGFANALAGGWGNAGQLSHPFMHMHAVEFAALLDGCWLLYSAVTSAAAESCVCASFLQFASVFLLLIYDCYRRRSHPGCYA